MGIKDFNRVQIDPTKVAYDGNSIRLIVKDEAELVKKLQQKQKEILKDLNRK